MIPPIRLMPWGSYVVKIVVNGKHVMASVPIAHVPAADFVEVVIEEYADPRRPGSVDASLPSAP